MFCGEVYIYARSAGDGNAAADGTESDADTADADCPTVSVHVPSAHWACHEHHAEAHHQTGMNNNDNHN